MNFRCRIGVVSVLFRCCFLLTAKIIIHQGVVSVLYRCCIGVVSVLFFFKL